jgi:DNA-binding NtrC family response regulator
MSGIAPSVYSRNDWIWDEQGLNLSRQRPTRTKDMGLPSPDLPQQRSRPPVVLLVDDDTGVHHAVTRNLAQVGVANVEHAYNVFQALDLLGRRAVDVLLLDLDLPGERGEKLLERLQPLIRGGRLEVVMLTSDSGVSTAMRCARLGALDYLVKTAEAYRALGSTVERALSARRTRRAEAVRLWTDETQSLVLHLARSRSPAVRQLLARLDELAATPGPVLIEARPGQKAAHLAFEVHRRSRPDDALFLSVDARGFAADTLLRAMGAEGLPADRLASWELAEGGTLFIDGVEQLDTVGRMALEGLLADTSPVRVIMAAPPGQTASLAWSTWLRVRDRRALAVPLSDRREDIPLILDDWSARRAAVGGQTTFSADAVLALQSYEWRRDLDELEELLAVLLVRVGSGCVELSDLPITIASPLLAQRAVARSAHGQVYERAMEILERDLFQQVLARHHGDLDRAAAELGVSAAVLRRQLQALGLIPPSRSS